MLIILMPFTISICGFEKEISVKLRFGITPDQTHLNSVLHVVQSLLGQVKFELFGEFRVELLQGHFVGIVSVDYSASHVRSLTESLVFQVGHDP